MSKDFDEYSAEEINYVMKALNSIFGDYRDEEDKTDSLYGVILYEAVGCTKEGVFKQRDTMKAMREMAPETKEDAFNTGMELCALADSMFINGNEKNALIRFVRSAIRYDIPEAQWRVGMCLYHGFYVKKDPEEAKIWFEESAKHKYVRATNSLIEYYPNSLFKETAAEARAEFISIIRDECISDW